MTRRIASQPHPLLIALVIVSLGAVTIPSMPVTGQSGSEAPISAATATLSGRVFDQASDAPLAGARIEISNWFSESGDSGETAEPAPDSDARAAMYCCPEEGFQHFSVMTDENGRYNVTVNQGRVELWVDVSGYDYLRAFADVTGDRTLDLPMQAGAERLSVITGTVRSDLGTPIENARLNAWVEHGDDCDGDVCIARPEPAQTLEEANGTSYHYEPRSDTYGWAETGVDGTYRIALRPGTVHLSAWADRHLSQERVVELGPGEEREVDLTLERVPPDSVVLTGRVVDAETGEGIPYAQVSVENQRWGAWNGTQTDETGLFTLTTKPGYTIFTVSAWKHYWLQACDEPVPLPASAEEGEVAPSSAAVSEEAVRAPEPYPDCSRERDREYFSHVTTFVGTTGPRTVNVELQPRPGPDATFQGWVVNATSEEGVADVHVSFHNEATGEWGQATTDEDGSYTIPVRAGYYTIRTWADGYYDGAQNAVIATGETKELTIFVQPGKRSHGHCCIAYAETAAVAREESFAGDDAGKAGGGAPAVAMDSASAGEGAADPLPPGAPTETQEASGEQTFQGTGGGLGPYSASANGETPPEDAVPNGEEDPETAPTPAPGLFLAALAIGVAAIVAGLRRW